MYPVFYHPAMDRSPIEQLPNEMLIHVVSFLAPRDVSRTRRVSRGFREITSDKISRDVIEFARLCHEERHARGLPWQNAVENAWRAISKEGTPDEAAPEHIAAVKRAMRERPMEPIPYWYLPDEELGDDLTRIHLRFHRPILALLRGRRIEHTENHSVYAQLIDDSLRLDHYFPRTLNFSPVCVACRLYTGPIADTVDYAAILPQPVELDDPDFKHALGLACVSLLDKVGKSRAMSTLLAYFDVQYIVDLMLDVTQLDKNYKHPEAILHYLAYRNWARTPTPLRDLKVVQHLLGAVVDVRKLATFWESIEKSSVLCSVYAVLKQKQTASIAGLMRDLFGPHTAADLEIYEAMGAKGQLRSLQLMHVTPHITFPKELFHELVVLALGHSNGSDAVDHIEQYMKELPAQVAYTLHRLTTIGDRNRALDLVLGAIRVAKTKRDFLQDTLTCFHERYYSWLNYADIAIQRSLIYRHTRSMMYSFTTFRDVNELFDPEDPRDSFLVGMKM